MAENFTAKQKEIVARKMGYDGPMQMFDEYLASTPSDAQRYAAVTSKFAERMAKGGLVRKYAEGGNVLPEGYSYTAPPMGAYSAVMPNEGMVYAYSPTGDRIQVPRSGPPTTPPKLITTPISTVAPDAGAPTLTAAPGYTAATTAVTDAMRIASPTAPAAAQATPAQIAEAATATPSAPVTAHCCSNICCSFCC